MGKTLAHACQWFLLRPLAFQVLLVLLAWIYLCLLHWDNDGLWFQGDAPRHAANGLFWKDYLQSFSLDPKGYALSYYARYPAISLTTYPPAFHLLEAAAFGLYGPSPYVAKGLVLCFALLAALYITAWLRRWVAPEAGWAGALVLLLPGVIGYAHAVLPNVPAFALSVGALYHTQRWLESPASRHIYGTAALSVLAVATYFPAGVIAFIALAWLIALRRWEAFRRPRTVVLAAVCLLLVLPSLWIVFRWTPGYVSANLSAEPWELSKWLYYIRHLDELFPPYLLALAGLGAVTGLWDPRWRRETGLLLLWAVVSYALFALLRAQHIRYLLPLSAVLICLCAMALLTIARWLAQLVHGSQQSIRVAGSTTIGAVLALQLWLAWGVKVPSLHGFQEIATFFAEKAPDEAVLYDGFFNNVFTFYVQAGDPDYRRRVVRGDKLLYASAVFQTVNVREFASSPEEVIEVLRTRGDCRWLAIESGDFPVWVPAAQTLRKVVAGPQFEYVRSFPVTGTAVNRVDVYRFLVPIQPSAEVDLPFPIMGGDAHERVKPISRRHSSSDADP